MINEVEACPGVGFAHISQVILISADMAARGAVAVGPGLMHACTGASWDAACSKHAGWVDSEIKHTAHHA